MRHWCVPCELFCYLNQCFSKTSLGDTSHLDLPPEGYRLEASHGNVRYLRVRSHQMARKSFHEILREKISSSFWGFRSFPVALRGPNVLPEDDLRVQNALNSPESHIWGVRSHQLARKSFHEILREHISFSFWGFWSSPVAFQGSNCASRGWFEGPEMNWRAQHPTFEGQKPPNDQEIFSWIFDGKYFRFILKV